ncbi:MAG: hypothetical protein ACRDT2_06725, partial [Natronosporangium sp.]
MSESRTLTLPVLPLDDLVALPGMVVPVALAEAEARAAIEAAEAASGRSASGARGQAAADTGRPAASGRSASGARGQAAADTGRPAAGGSGEARVLLVPRLDGKYA